MAASAHTLVVIAIERYYAICQPLHSRRWQTRRHCYKMIGAVWLLAVLLNLPYAVFARVQKVQPAGKLNCAPAWPHEDFHRYYWLFLGIVLFVIPSLVMTVLYCAVVQTLYRGIECDSVAAGANAGGECLCLWLTAPLLPCG